eukprot:14363201-Alexandrium_andersonii.AAC.1
MTGRGGQGRVYVVDVPACKPEYGRKAVLLEAGAGGEAQAPRGASSRCRRLRLFLDRRQVRRRPREVPVSLALLLAVALALLPGERVAQAAELGHG